METGLLNLERQVNEHKISVMINYSDTLKIVCTAKWMKAYVRECLKYKRMVVENRHIVVPAFRHLPTSAPEGEPLKGDSIFELFNFPSSIQGMDVEINNVQSVDFLVTKA